MAVTTPTPLIKEEPTSPTPVAQLPTPSFSTVIFKFEAPSSGDEIEASPTAAKGPKRKCSATLDDSNYEPTTPMASSKKAKPTVTPVRKPRKKPTKSPTQLEAAANKARQKAERDTIDAAKNRRADNLKEWKKDWIKWLASNRKDDDDSLDASGINCLSVTKCHTYFNLKRDELKALPHEARLNLIKPGYPAMRLYSYSNVLDLSCRKEAIHAGVSQDDETALIARGRALLRQKKGCIPSHDEVMLGARMSGQRRREESDSEEESEIECDPCANNMLPVEWLQDNPREWFNRPKGK